jgi:hypothetical protein
MEWKGGLTEYKVENILRDVESKNKDTLESAKIKPMSDEWLFSTNGLYLMFATAGSGKSRFIIKHVQMADRIIGGLPYYSLICYCSTSGELDRTVQVHLDANNIKTPLVQISDDNLMNFLSRHLRRKKKYYAMIEYIRSKMKKINPTLQKSIDKHNFKFFVPDRKRLTNGDLIPAYRTEQEQIPYIEKLNKPKLLKWIVKKISEYDVDKAICPLLVILDDFAGHKLIERK